MQVSFLHNHLNHYFLSPIPCCAREEYLIMIFLSFSINNGLNPTISIVYLVNQTASVLKSLFSLCLSLQLLIVSSKSSKVAKNKPGVRMRGVPMETSSTLVPAETPGSTTTKQPLEVEPFQHTISSSVKGDFSKKLFKTGTSKRYRSSMPREGPIPAPNPVPKVEEEEINVDAIIKETTENILNEAADQVLGSDVEPEAATSGNPKNSNLESAVGKVMLILLIKNLKKNQKKMFLNHLMMGMMLILMRVKQLWLVLTRQFLMIPCMKMHLSRTLFHRSLVQVMMTLMMCLSPRAFHPLWLQG